MQIGMGFLGWIPDVFWDATLKEMNCAVKGKSAADSGKPIEWGVTREELFALMERYPDGSS